MNSKCVSAVMYSIRRIEYIMLIFLKVKPSYACQYAYLTLLMLDLFLYNAKMDILRRKGYANVRNIILKHMFITVSFVFITTSGNLLLYRLCYEDNFP